MVEVVIRKLSLLWHPSVVFTHLFDICTSTVFSGIPLKLFYVSVMSWFHYRGAVVTFECTVSVSFGCGPRNCLVCMLL